MPVGVTASQPTMLVCWKDIASYLGKGVRTVQRWEQELGLPIRRPDQGQRHMVCASPAELDSWLKNWSERHKAGAIVLTSQDQLSLIHAYIRESRELCSTHRQLRAELRQNCCDLTRGCMEVQQSLTATAILTPSTKARSSAT